MGVLLSIVGFVLKAFPPKNINWFIGYRTPRAMKSQQAWDYAQVAGGKRLAVAGLVLAAIGLPLIYVKGISAEVQAYLVFGSVLLTIIIPVVLTERDLKSKFD